MQWIQYLILALFLWLIVSRLLPVQGLQHLEPQDVEQLLEQPGHYAFVDVRQPGEYGRGHIEGFVNIPLGQLSQRVAEIDRERPVVLTCQSGIRSRQAARILRKQGFTDVRHLRRGVGGWTGRLVKS